MINETKGDVAEFLNDFKNRNPNKTLVLIHQCNCFNTLGRARGFAGVLDKMFPQIVVADQATTKGDGNKLGQYSKAKIDDNLWIFNAYGQYYYGMSPDIMYTDYDALQNSLGFIKTLTLTLVFSTILCGCEDKSVASSENLTEAINSELSKQIIWMALPGSSVTEGTVSAPFVIVDPYNSKNSETNFLGIPSLLLRARRYSHPKVWNLVLERQVQAASKKIRAFGVSQNIIYFIELSFAG